MNWKRTIASILTTLSIAALMTAGLAFPGGFGDGVVPSAQAQAQNASGAFENARQRRCTNGSLKGAYGFTAQGFTLSGAPLPAALLGPFATGGLSVFDGQGNFTLTANSSFNGAIQPPLTVKGTYSVNEDCTYTSQAENGVSFRSVIVNGGQEILILQTTPNVVVAGIAKKISPQARSLQEQSLSEQARQPRCTNGVIQGSYGFLAEGFAGPPTLPLPTSGPLAGVGTVAFDPRGSFTLTAVRSVNGALDPQPVILLGSYAVNDDCTFTMKFDVGFTFRAVIVDGGREILFVETDPGTALTVKARRI